MSDKTLWGPYSPFKHYEVETACTCTVQYESHKGTFRHTSIQCPVHGLAPAPVGVPVDQAKEEGKA